MGVKVKATITKSSEKKDASIAENVSMDRAYPDDDGSHEPQQDN